MVKKVNLIILIIVAVATCVSACTPELVELKEVPIKTNETSIKTNETTNKTSETTVNATVVPENVKTVKLVTGYSSDTLVEDMETIKFGLYPQSDVNGSKKDPIEWIVLEKTGNGALLLSKYILDCKNYNNTYDNVTWETCDLRKWLNSDFYNKAFNSSEQSVIKEINLVNNDNSEYKTSGGANTSDKVFCLSEEEIRKYFGNGEKKEYSGQVCFELGKNVTTKGTEYAKNVDNGGTRLDVFNEVDKTYEAFFGNSNYWLRSPGYFQNCAACVGCTGTVDISAIDIGVIRNDYGVRPAIWIEW